MSTGVGLMRKEDIRAASTGCKKGLEHMEIRQLELTDDHRWRVDTSYSQSCAECRPRSHGFQSRRAHFDALSPRSDVIAVWCCRVVEDRRRGWLRREYTTPAGVCKGAYLDERIVNFRFRKGGCDHLKPIQERPSNVETYSSMRDEKQR